MAESQKGHERTMHSIQRVMDKNQAPFYYAYVNRLRHNSQLEGTIKVSFEVLPDGRVNQVRIIEDNIGDSVLAADVVKVFSDINFGAVNDPKPYQVAHYKLTFKAP